ncbi:hypothetical protein [Gottfriedia acidiceleris]|uniref:hypothetical protein n=1 Tax=Gottfriedia acidiceleris TaxID=371036 RepID=UPI003D1952FA
MFDGKGTLYSQDGEIKATGFFSEGMFLTGKVYGYSNSLSKIYKYQYETIGSTRNIIKGELFDTENKLEEHFYFNGEYKDWEIINGLTTKFHSNGVIAFRGNLVNGIKEGKGISYNNDGKLIFEGLFRSGQKHKGTLLRNGIEEFNGEFKDGSPWSGQVKKFDFYSEKVKNFTGEIKGGLPFCGVGYRFKRNNYGEDLDFIFTKNIGCLKIWRVMMSTKPKNFMNGRINK